MPTVQIRRYGTAKTRRASIDGVQLKWKSDNTSQPKNLSKGKHHLSWYVKGQKGQTYKYRFVKPSGQKCKPEGTLKSKDGKTGACPFNL